jgi:hypothetical protein
MSDFFCDPLEDKIIYHTEYKVFFAPPVYIEQLYSLIVWSKPGFFPIGHKTTANSIFYDTYLFRINFFFFTRGAVCSPKAKPEGPTKHRR